MDEGTFRRHLWVTWAQFDVLLTEFRNAGINSSTHNHPDIPLTQKVLMFLWYMANQNSFREIEDKFNVAQSAAHRAIIELLNATCSGSADYSPPGPTTVSEEYQHPVFPGSLG